MKIGVIVTSGIYTLKPATTWLKTNTTHAPWLVVPADHKKTSRIEIMKYIIRKCEKYYGCQGLLSDKLITELDESWNQETIDYRNVSWFFYII